MAASAERLAVVRWLPLVGIWALACSVDHRTLHSASDDLLGAGASPSTGATTASGGENGSTGGTMSPSPDAGAGGAAPDPGSSGGSSTASNLPPLVNGCADLDTDMVGDCTVTLVKNAAFKSDVASWTAVDPAMLAWDPRNALADTPSGCALLTVAGSTDIDGSALFRASQCVPIPGRQIVIAYANAIVDAMGGAADQTSQAELEVSFFDSDDCSGAPTGQFSTPTSAAPTWATIQAGGVSPSTTASASVALAGVKPLRADKLSICFDNVMLKTKAL